MRAVVVMAMAMVLGASGAALAQRAPLFISPMGEPFRSQEGAAPIQVWFAAADADHDGKLSQAEFLAQAQSFFTATLDANHDGDATSLESTTLYRAQAPEVFTPMAALPTQEQPRRRFIRPQDASTHSAPARPRDDERRSGAAA